VLLQKCVRRFSAGECIITFVYCPSWFEVHPFILLPSWSSRFFVLFDVYMLHRLTMYFALSFQGWICMKKPHISWMRRSAGTIFIHGMKFAQVENST
jgi:hypothetical protein